MKAFVTAIASGLPCSFQKGISDSLAFVQKLVVVTKAFYSGLRLVDESYILSNMRCSSAEVCHILCSGWSLNDSIASIKDRDFVIGFNFSFLAYENADLHFAELVSTKTQVELSKCLAHGLTDTKCFDERKIVFKNLWDKRFNSKLYRKIYGKNSCVVKDFLVRRWSPKCVIDLVDELTTEGNWVRQYSSSSITAIALALKSKKFKKIVVHGLDFSGPHFYHDHSFKCLPKFRECLDCLLLHRAAPTNNNQSHITENRGLGQSMVIRELSVLAKKNSVVICSGSEKSPLHSILTETSAYYSN